jgi:tetratricopeptide (TPR) repeat protein
LTNPPTQPLAALEARARQLAVIGPADEAKQLNLQILEIDTANLDALRRLGKISKDTGDSDAAIAYFRRVLEIRPDDLIAKNQLDRLEGGPIHSAPQRVEWVTIQATMAALLQDVAFAAPMAGGEVDVRWPTGVEHFSESWDVKVALRAETIGIRHVLGHRVAYGRLRRRSLTFVRDKVEVEGGSS